MSEKNLVQLDTLLNYSLACISDLILHYGTFILQK